MDMNQFDPNLFQEEPNEPLEPNHQPEQPVEQPAQPTDWTPTEMPLWLTPMDEPGEEIRPDKAPDPIPPSYAMPTNYPVGQVPAPRPAKRKTWLWILLVCVGVVLALIVSTTIGFIAGRALRNSDENGPTTSQSATPNSSKDEGNAGDKSDFEVATGKNDGQAYSYEQIVAKVAPAIVNITVYSADGKKGSYASGIIMDAKLGYVLTNDHIYSKIPNAKFLITLNDGNEFAARFVSGDSRSDIAILKIDNPKNLTAATFSTDTLTVGERVLVMGQSYGYADTVSEGIVSAVNRRLSLSGGSYSERYIQTTAAINPGNSGGALVNLYGQVVGMPSAKISSEEVESLGFAIPTDRLLSIVDNLKKNGTVKGRAKLGITYTEVGTVLSEIETLPVGVYVQSVESKSDVAKKGISKGDVITKINGKAVTIAAVLLDEIENATAGDVVTLEVYDGSSKNSKTVKVELMESEGSHSYQTKDEDMNDLPENPYEFYFGED